MGGGCLSPKPRIGQIYIDCVNSIYQEVKKAQKNFSQDMYSSLKKMIIKKGLLRKLTDYLQCHRSMISEAVLHNYRIMIQSKDTYSKVTSLIIVDYIIESVLKKNKIGETSKVLQLQDQNAYSTYESSEIKKDHSLPNTSIVKKSHNSLSYNEQSFKQNEDPFNNMQQSNKNQQGLSLMHKQLCNIKFHNIYFNMLRELICTEQVYQYCIQSILVYGSINSAKSNTQQHIVDILKIIIQNITQKNSILKSLKCYYILLQKLKDNNIQKEISNIRLFFQLWDENYKESQKHIQQQYHQNANFNDNDKFKFKQNESLSHNLSRQKAIVQKIITKFISLSVGVNSCNQIYSVILGIYDYKKFCNMENFQSLLISTTKNQDLKSKFFRGLYCQLLCYFAVCKCQFQNLPYLWSNLSVSKPIQSYFSQYKNLLDKQVKKQVMHTLKKWLLQYAFVDINNIIRYNLSLFMHSFDFNILCSKDQQFYFMVSEVFCEICLTANSCQKIMIVNSLFQQLKVYQKEVKHKLLNLSVIEQLFQKHLLNKNIDNPAIHFCQCDQGNQFKVNTKIIQLITKIIKQYGIVRSMSFVDQISYFLYSVYQFVVKNTYQLLEFSKILKDIQRLLKQIQNNSGQLILLAYTERILKAQDIQTDNFNLFKTVDFFCALVTLLLNSVKLTNRSKYKKTVNQTYLWSVKINQVKQKITSVNTQQIFNEVIKVQAQIKSQQNWIETIKIPQRDEFSIMNQEKVYQNASIIFRDMFQRGVSVINSKFRTTEDQMFKNTTAQTHQNGFSRINSVIQVQDIGDQDKSFRDIMDMINI